MLWYYFTRLRLERMPVRVRSQLSVLDNTALYTLVSGLINSSSRFSSLSYLLPKLERSTSLYFQSRLLLNRKLFVGLRQIRHRRVVVEYNWWWSVLAPSAKLCCLFHNVLVRKETIPCRYRSQLAAFVGSDGARLLLRCFHPSSCVRILVSVRFWEDSGLKSPLLTLTHRPLDDA